MSRYLLKDELLTEEFYVSDDGKDITIKDDLDDVPESERGKYTKESIEYRVPSWNEISNMTEAASGGMSPFPNQQMIDRTLIALYLYKTSFFEIKRGQPEGESDELPDQVLNIDELIGPKGVVPTLINKILLTIRRRM